MSARKTYGILAVLAGDVRREFAAVEAPRNAQLERAHTLMAAQRARAAGFLAFSGALISLSEKSVDTRGGGAQNF